MRDFIFPGKEKKDRLAEQAAAYILSLNDETIRTLTAADVAAKVNMNLIFLSFIFKIAQKISIANFILREKLHRAFFILDKNRDISILELAKILGFAEAEIFEAEFEKYYAIKPILFQELREKNRDFDKTGYKLPGDVFEQLRDIV